MPNCKVDFSDLKAQFSPGGRKNKQFKDGINVGLKKIAPTLEEMFKFYQQEHVYDAYAPKQYKRTYKFRDSVKSEINGNTLLVYADPNQIQSNGDSKPYSYHIKYGYHHWGREDFTPPRDWVNPMVEELKIHLEQSGIIGVVVKEIQNRV